MSRREYCMRIEVRVGALIRSIQRSAAKCNKGSAIVYLNPDNKIRIAMQGTKIFNSFMSSKNSDYIGLYTADVSANDLKEDLIDALNNIQ